MRHFTHDGRPLRFADPRTDFGFYRIFDNENAREILASFLNAVLDLDKNHSIADIQRLELFVLPRTQYLRLSLIDAECFDVLGESYFVKMGISRVPTLAMRSLRDGSVTRSHCWPKPHQVLAINIIDFILFNDFEHYLSCHQVREKNIGNSYHDEIRYYFIELPKFKKTEKELETFIEKWVYFIKHAGDLEAIPKKLDEPIFHKAFNQARRANMTTKELEAYDNSIRVMMDERGRIEGACKKAGKIWHTKLLVQ